MPPSRVCCPPASGAAAKALTASRAEATIAEGSAGEESRGRRSGFLSREQDVARLRRVVLERLIRYYRYLAELTARRDVDTVTSGHLGRMLDVDPSQVRKDFAAVGLAGVSRVGYDVCEVCRTIRTVLGFDSTYDAVLVGTGQLGGALLTYGGFDRYGLRIVAAFDADPAKVGTRKGGYRILSVHDLRSFIEEHEVSVAILTTPVDVAQGLAELAALAGVRAIWNFSPTRLSVPEGILVRNEHISLGLAEISFHLHEADGNVGAPAGRPVSSDTRPATSDACCNPSTATAAADRGES